MALALNLSFVLHERSDSAAVARTLAACRQHAARRARLDTPAAPDTIDGVLPAGIDLWLTASVGVPERLPAALDALGVPRAALLRVDVDVDAVSVAPHESGLAVALHDATLFRAPARLLLPSAPCRVAVVARVLRPAGRTTQLVLRGAYRWPEESGPALRALERIIQPWAEQWLPPRALWEHPAEVLLHDEIGRAAGRS